MKEKIEEQALKNILQNAQIAMPSEDLTQSILDQILKAKKATVIHEGHLNTLLKNAELPEAPLNITATILSKIEVSRVRNTAYKPLVSRTVKIVYGILITVGIIFLLFTKDGLMAKLEAALKLFDFFSLSPFVICSIAFAFLLFFETIFKRFKWSQ